MIWSSRLQEAVPTLCNNCNSRGWCNFYMPSPAETIKSLCKARGQTTPDHSYGRSDVGIGCGDRMWGSDVGIGCGDRMWGSDVGIGTEYRPDLLSIACAPACWGFPRIGARIQRGPHPEERRLLRRARFWAIDEVAAANFSVVLSAAKDLIAAWYECTFGTSGDEILRCAQDDRRGTTEFNKVTSSEEPRGARRLESGEVTFALWRGGELAQDEGAASRLGRSNLRPLVGNSEGAATALFQRSTVWPILRDGRCAASSG